MFFGKRGISVMVIAFLMCFTSVAVYGQDTRQSEQATAQGGGKNNRAAEGPGKRPPEKKKKKSNEASVERIDLSTVRYRVVGGILQQTAGAASNNAIPKEQAAHIADSLLGESSRVRVEAAKLLVDADSLTTVENTDVTLSDSLRVQSSLLFQQADSLASAAQSMFEMAAETDSTSVVPGNASLSGPVTRIDEKPLTERQIRRQEREMRHNDPSFVRYSKIFPDTLPLPRMAAISFVVPGFSQLHNKQAWKIPILYAAVGASIYLGIDHNKCYTQYKKQYDRMVSIGAPQSERDKYQKSMIKYNTNRQLFFGAAVLTYIYFIGDGAVNYPGYASGPRKATTLSMICPGAGQIYNKSYWKVPIVVGSLATMAYMIDWNNRGYKRFKLAYDLLTDGDPATVDEFGGMYSDSFIRNYRNSYRRSRDLCIILAGAAYLLNVVDAHVDANMKDYDIDDNLNVSIEPSVTNIYMARTGSSSYTGLNLSFKF